MTSTRVLLTEPFDSVDQRFANMRGTRPLTVNVLWEIAYSIHQESLYLDSLEDFNATEANIMRMKDDILATRLRLTRKTRLRLRKTTTARCQKKVQIRTRPMTQIPTRMSFWGCQLIFPYPGTLR